MMPLCLIIGCLSGLYKRIIVFFTSDFWSSFWLGMLVHNCSPSTEEAETRGSWVGGQPGLHGEFKASLSYTGRTCLKKTCAGDIAQCETLGSIPNTTKEKNSNNNNNNNEVHFAYFFRVLFLKRFMWRKTILSVIVFNYVLRINSFRTTKFCILYFSG
jgi:hypothetical protein